MTKQNLKERLQKLAGLLKEQEGDTLYTNWFIGNGPIIGGYEWYPGYSGPTYTTNSAVIGDNYSEGGPNPSLQGCSTTCCGSDFMSYCPECNNIESIITHILQNSNSSGWLDISSVFSEALGPFGPEFAASYANNFCVNSSGVPYTFRTGGFQLTNWLWNGYGMDDSYGPAYPGYGIIGGGAQFPSFQAFADYMQEKGIDMDSMTSYQDIVNAWNALGNDSNAGGFGEVCSAGSAQLGSCSSLCRCTSKCVAENCLEAVIGCTDPTACNYNPDATNDPDTYGESNLECEYESCIGCIDPEAINYSENATIDDGSCYYTLEGCMDETADNYDPNATEEGGMCEWSVYECIQGWGAMAWFASCGDITQGFSSEENVTISNTPPDNINTFSSFMACSQQCGSDPIQCWKCEKGNPVMQQVFPNTEIDDLIYYYGMDLNDETVSDALLQNTCKSLGDEWQPAPNPWPYTSQNNPCKKEVDCKGAKIPEGCCKTCKAGIYSPECEPYCHCCKKPEGDGTTITNDPGPADFIQDPGSASMPDRMQTLAGIKPKK